MTDSLVQPAKLDRLRTLLLSTQHLNGDIVEVGVYKGGSAKVLVDNAGDSRVFLFDTFAGMPHHDMALDGRWEVGSFSDTSEESIRSMFAGNDRVSVHAGVFPDDAGDVLAGAWLRFVHLDVDNYASYADALEYLYRIVVPGGILVFDDYGEDCCPGAKAAVDEFFLGHAQVVIDGTAYVVKK